MITGTVLERYFQVIPETGEVFRLSESLKNGRTVVRTGYIKPGTPSTGGGYRMVSIPCSRQKVRAHHLVWCWVYGEWPKDEIDHINGDRDDNRIGNLRLATSSQNKLNKRVQSNNKSGYKWVRWERRRRLWCADIVAPKSMGMGRKRLHCSFHKTPEEAYAAACAAAKELFGEWFNPGVADR